MRYYIYCISRNMFWRPNRMGYTGDIMEAGIYYFYEVASIVLSPFNRDELAVEVDKVSKFVLDNVASLASNISEDSVCEPDCQSPDDGSRETDLFLDR